MHDLTFDIDEIAEGISSLEAMASTAAAQHAAVMAEVQQALDWAWRHFPWSHGSIGDGMAWDHELQVSVGQDQSRTVSFTRTGNDRFVREFLAAFGPALD